MWGIDGVESGEVGLPDVAALETGGWREEACHAIVVRLEADGVTAWGESPVGENPFYNEENYQTAWIIQQAYLTPMLMAAHLSKSHAPTPAPAPPLGRAGAPDDGAPTFTVRVGDRSAAVSCDDLALAALSLSQIEPAVGRGARRALEVGNGEATLIDES